MLEIFHEKKTTGKDWISIVEIFYEKELKTGLRLLYHYFNNAIHNSPPPPTGPPWYQIEVINSRTFTIFSILKVKIRQTHTSCEIVRMYLKKFFNSSCYVFTRKYYYIQCNIQQVKTYLPMFKFLLLSVFSSLFKIKMFI